jgi:thioredoxin-related protein
MIKKILFGLAPLALTAMAFTVGEPLPIGSKLPMADTKMELVSGKQKSLQDLATKKGLLVMFSCNTCPYVIKNQERTVEINKYAAKNGFGVVVVNSNEAQRSSDDSFEAMKKYADDQKYTWAYAVDKNSSIADAFGANRTPECFLFDGNMKLVYHGAIDDNPSDATDVKRHHLKEAIDELNAGKDISVKESRSVGCTIKRLK